MSALKPEAVDYSHKDAETKVKGVFANILKWDDIKYNLPPNIKVAPLTMIPHKISEYCTIIDLLFILKTVEGEVPSVNEKKTRNFPPGVHGSDGKRVCSYHRSYGNLATREGAHPLLENRCQRWFLEIMLHTGKRVEFLLHPIAAPRGTHIHTCSIGTANGMDGITTILQRGIGDSTRCGEYINHGINRFSAGKSTGTSYNAKGASSGQWRGIRG